MRLFITGDIVKKCERDIDPGLNFMEILNTYGEGMLKNKRVMTAQVGGPFGEFVKGRDLYSPLSKYIDGIEVDTIFYYNENFCPVDYFKFLTRYVQNHLGINTEDITVMRKLAETLGSPEGEEEDYLKIVRYSKKDADHEIEKKYKEYAQGFLEENRESFREHYEDKFCAGTICRRMFDAQCINACPAGVRIPGYVELMEHGKMKDAYALMKQANPLSFVCGKICPRPCEDRCKRGELEQTVGVRALQRYAAEMSIHEFNEERLEDKGKKVSIVGAGPAGLTAAYFLGKTGYKVTVYDANKNAGGMLATGIPEYRLPQKTIDVEVELIKGLGVEIKTGTKIGEDLSLSQLRGESDAILLATGCQIGNMVPGMNGHRMEAAVDFLKEVKTQKRKDTGENVLVIGGGDVAMDAARTALRLGAQVTVVSLEVFEQMPASIEERSEALEEGVIFKSGYGVASIDGSTVSFRRCSSIVDMGFNFSPEFEEERIDGSYDHIIFAIGQRPDNSYFSKDIKESSPGKVDHCEKTYQTSAKDVFAAGDMAGVGTAVSAIAHGKKAAASIDKYLGGKGLFLGREIEVPEVPLNTEIWNTAKRGEAILSLNKRIDNFNEVGTIFTPDNAKCEAMRCMRCDRNSRRRY